MLIKYKLADGRVVEIEVSDAVGEIQIEFDAEDEREVWRSKKRKDKSIDYLKSLGVELPDTATDIESSYIVKEDLRRLNSAIEKLKPEQQKLVRQIFFDGLNQVEVARLENVDPTTIRDRLKTIYKKLKQFL